MEINQQQQEGKTTTRSQLYELTPPMDPSNDNNNDRTFRGKNITKHSNSTTTTCSPPTPPILFNRLLAVLLKFNFLIQGLVQQTCLEFLLV